MARIAVGGFRHETNCFVEPKTDFAYFAEHRDRPPLVRGPEVLEWISDTSFALSGFLSDRAMRIAQAASRPIVIADTQDNLGTCRRRS